MIAAESFLARQLDASKTYSRRDLERRGHGVERLVARAVIVAVEAAP